MKTVWIIALLVVIACTYSHVAFASDQPDPRQIQVNGDAEVRVVPDEVILTLGVETLDEDLQVAKNQNDEIVQNILKLAKKYDIDKKRVQTDYISIEPKYESMRERTNFVGYLVRKTILFTLRDPSRFEDLLTSVLEAGANYVHGVQFQTTELRKYKDQARALAIEAAREKAEQLAGELGQKIGRPLTIREERSRSYSWYNAWWGPRRGGIGMGQNVSQDAIGASEDAGSSIALGQINITARVRVSFELE